MTIETSSRVSPKYLWLAGSVVALLLLLSAASSAVREIRLEMSGVRATGRVVSYTIPNDRSQGARVEVDVVRPGGAAVRVHLINASRGGWQEGMEVPLLCAELAPESRSCEVYSPGSWIAPTSLTVVMLALIFFLAARKLRAARSR